MPISIQTLDFVSFRFALPNPTLAFWGENAFNFFHSHQSHKSSWYGARTFVFVLTEHQELALGTLCSTRTEHTVDINDQATRVFSNAAAFAGTAPTSSNYLRQHVPRSYYWIWNSLATRVEPFEPLSRVYASSPASIASVSSQYPSSALRLATGASGVHLCMPL